MKKLLLVSVVALAPFAVLAADQRPGGEYDQRRRGGRHQLDCGWFERGRRQLRGDARGCWG